MARHAKLLPTLVDQTLKFYYQDTLNNYFNYYPKDFTKLPSCVVALDTENLVKTPLDYNNYVHKGVGHTYELAIYGHDYSKGKGT